MQINLTTETTNTTNTSTPNNNKTNAQSFSSALQEEQEKTEQNNEIGTTNSTAQLTQTTEELIADIISVLKTGLTVGELEHLQELLAKIQKLMAEKADGDSDSVGEIEALLSSLEKELMTLQKRLTGESIIETEDEVSTQSESNDPVIQNFLSRINTVITIMDDLVKEKLEKIELDEDMLSKLYSEDELSQESIEKIKNQYNSSLSDENKDTLFINMLEFKARVKNLEEELQNIKNDETDLQKSNIDEEFRLREKLKI